MKTYNKFLIVSTIVIFISGFYLYSLNDLNAKGGIPVAFGSSLSSSTGADPVVASSVKNEVDSDILFLATLAIMKKITIDTTLFADKFFNGLINNKVELTPVVPGRTNPFAPIGSKGDSNFVPIPAVVTGQPTEVTSSTAILNGTIKVSDETTVAYFEYGTTPSLGSITTNTKPSLIGTFIKSVSGLTPQTNYFARACTNTNKIKLCGEVISFITN